MTRDYNAISNELASAILGADRLEELFEKLGCVMKPNGARTVYRGRCVIHDGKNPDSLVVNTNGDSVPINWKCMTEQCHNTYKPSLLGLVVAILSANSNGRVSPSVAEQFLRDFVGPNIAACIQNQHCRPVREESVCRIKVSTATLKREMVIPSSYFLGRGFSRRTLTEMYVGDFEDYHFGYLGRVPLFDNDLGEYCIGFYDRAAYSQCPICQMFHWEQANCGYGRPKWMISKHFRKGEYVYNYGKVRNSSKSYLVLTEGPGDVWRCHQADIPAVALLGLELSENQADKIAALAHGGHHQKEVLVLLDNDEAGRKAVPAVHGKLLAKGVNVRICYPPAPYKDAGEMPSDALRSFVLAQLECETPV